MGWFKTTVIGLSAAVSMFAAGAAQAGTLELIYWDNGDLTWFQLDGVSYTVDDYAVTVKNVYPGWHTMSYGANGTSHTLSVNLDASNAADTDYWCMDLRLDRFELLDGYDCEDMWDYYLF